jgi:large subunit ribosomal protein L23
MEMRDILVRPLTTEKTEFNLGLDWTYAFEVNPRANKVEIKAAVESFYGVEVDRVRTLIVRGKIKRHGRFSGKRSNWKKAYVTLREGQVLPGSQDQG